MTARPIMFPSCLKDDKSEMMDVSLDYAKRENTAFLQNEGIRKIVS